LTLGSTLVTAEPQSSTCSSGIPASLKAVAARLVRLRRLVAAKGDKPVTQGCFKTAFPASRSPPATPLSAAARPAGS